MKMLIQGTWIDGDRKLKVENPATNEVIDTVPIGSIDDVEQAVEAGREAFHEDWKGISFEDRKNALLRIADALEGGQEELARTLVAEVGKPLAEARHEVISSARVFRRIATLTIEEEMVRDDEGTHVYVAKRPIGVAGLILPWNYPLTVLSWKLAPALLTGNTAVIKPSPYTPLNTLRVGKLMEDILPPGVVNIVTGDDRTGEAIVRSSGVGKIAFTGNAGTGKTVMRECAMGMKRISLELGGNDPGIVLEDFDLDQINNIFWSSFRNAGQICIAVKRVYVHEKLYTDFLRKYVAIAEKVRVGNGMDPGVQMGPVNNPEQLSVVEGMVKDARDLGGNIRCGGERSYPDGTTKGGEEAKGPSERRGVGYFYPPTVITDVDDSARIVREEQFGPVVPILPFSDVEEVIDRVNALPYGLGASVWTGNVDRGVRIAGEVQSGIAWVNTHMVVDPLAPFGGVKESGFGRELGKWGLEEYLNIQTIHVKR